jgi:(E)-4-hydroxy-3-methylbut-2-enyl-diphosphate synthase
MTNTPTADQAGTIEQIRRLALAGCQIVRVAVPDETAAAVLPAILRASPLPLIADIHFDYRLALRSLAAGVAGLRLNPGNIGAAWKVGEVARAAAERRVPIRIGVNSGSLEKRLLERYGGPTAAALVESALFHVRLLEEQGYGEIKISLKASRVPLMLAAYRRIAGLVDYPLHLGVTEAGLPAQGVVKSAVGIGTLLAEGIGDTLRVSLTGDPVPEVAAARQILIALELIPGGWQLIACPTCGRTGPGFLGLVEEVDRRLRQLPAPAGRTVIVAVMGCVVNGPGEGRAADYGIACGGDAGVLFAAGEKVARLPLAELVDALMELLRRDWAGRSLPADEAGQGAAGQD